MPAMIEETKPNGSTTMSIRLGNQDFALERKLVTVEWLKLDPANQRLSYKLRLHGVFAKDEDLQKLLWKQDAVKELYDSVKNNGGLIDDPIARRDGTVVEGNCRTVVLRQLRKDLPKDGRFEKVYVRLLPDNVTDEQLMMLLGELHVAGKIRWGAYEEAEYVWKMHNVFHKTYEYLVSHLRWSKSKLSQKIIAYEETKKYLEQTGDPQGATRFSFFEEFMKKKELRERYNKDQGVLKEFGQWIFNGLLKEALDVRDLPAIIANPEAFGKFKKGNLGAAKHVLYAANPSLVSGLYSVIDEATSQLRNIPLTELEDLRDGAAAKIQKIKELKDAIEKVAKHASLKL
jgi:hypothetical protein